MKTSERGIEFIKKWESLLLEAYQDTGGTWTIGWGHTKSVKKGDRITRFMAEEYLRSDLLTCERAVETLVQVQLSQHQFDALVSFTFNLGPGSLKSSTLLKVINENPADPEIARQFRRWVYCKGVVLPGLVSRRSEEAKMYFDRLA